MYEPGYEFSPMERQQQQQQQQQQILQKLDSTLFFQDALRVAGYHPYNSPSALYATSPLGGFTAGAAGLTPSSTFAAAALNVLSAIPSTSQFAHMQQQQSQQLQSTENGSMTRNNNNEPTSIIDESQAIPSGVGGIASSITPQNIGRAFNYYDLPSQIDSPQQGFTPNYFPPVTSVAATGTSLIGSSFNRQTSQQQQQQQASTSSASADYSFSSVAAALKNKGLHPSVQQLYDSPRNFGPSAFLPYVSQSVGPSGLQSFMQAASDSLKQPIFFPENEEGSPMHFLQTPVQQFQESITPRQIFNPTQHHHIQSAFQQPQQSQQHHLASQMLLQSQSNRQGLNLLQQQQQMKQLQRYNQEKAALQQQQFEIQQQARLASQQQFQNTSANNEQLNNQNTQIQQEDIQSEKVQLNQPIEPNLRSDGQIKTKQQKKLINQQEEKEPKKGNLKQQGPQNSSNTLGSGKQDSNASQTCQTHVNINLMNPILSVVDQKGQIQKQQQLTGQTNANDEEEDDDEEESIEEDEETEGQEKQDDVDDDEEDEEDEDEDYCQDGRKRSKKQSNSSKPSKNKGGMQKHKKISKNNKYEPNGVAISKGSSRSRKQINETKNIPKNYSKAIIGFIQKHPDECSSLLGKDYSFTEFEQFLVDRKEKLTAIKDLRSLWTARAENQKLETFNRVFRILSFKFFRENAVAYIYSSRKIKNTKALITYRFILQRALHDPESFQFMKLQN